MPRARNTSIPALDEALAGKPPVIGATEAPGCSLEPDTSKAKAVPLTYHARIERIVQANCVECHRAGGAAPVRSGEVRGRGRSQGDDQEGRGSGHDAAVVRRVGWKGQAFALLERSLTHRFGPERSDRLARGRPQEGRPGRCPASAKVRFGLADRHARQGLSASPADRGQGRRGDAVPERGDRHRLRRGQVGAGAGGPADRARSRPPRAGVRVAEGGADRRRVDGLPRGLCARQQHARLSRRLRQEAAQGHDAPVPDSLHAQRQGHDRPDAARRDLREGTAQARGSGGGDCQRHVPDSRPERTTTRSRLNCRCRSMPACWPSSPTPTCAARRCSTN